MERGGSFRIAQDAATGYPALDLIKLLGAGARSAFPAALRGVSRGEEAPSKLRPRDQDRDAF